MKEQPLREAYHWLLNTLKPGKVTLRKGTTEQNNAEEDDRVIGKSVDAFTTDLTLLAVKGKLQNVIGRDDEIKQLILILSRKTKPNPLLKGEAGVGKTAIVHGLAQRIVSGDVDPIFPIHRILQVDLFKLYAGAGILGESEQRFNDMLDSVKGNGTALFIDEIHMIMGVKATLPLADSLKPFLASGEIKVIGATTNQEFRRIEEDAALARRFSVISVNEPDSDQTIEILLGIASDFESHHGVSIPDSILESIVSLAHRCIPHRCFPDSAIDILDMSCSLCRFSGDESVTEEHILEAVERISGIPVHIHPNAMEIDKYLSQHIIGQDKAIDSVANAFRAKQAGLVDILGFMFIGPTGVGKTEMAKILAQFIGNPDSLIRLDMSEYMEQHTVSKLIGSPPGYVGYDRGGTLTEAVKNLPNSVVLFDEIEKSHPDIFNILLQILDYGNLTDSSGCQVNFKEAIVILTSNAPPDQLKSYFRPELLGRLSIVPFRSLNQDDMCAIAEIELEKLKARLTGKVDIQYDDEVLLHFAGGDLEYGARDLKSRIQDQAAQPIANLILQEDFSTITLAADDGEITLTGKRRIDQ